MVRSVMAELASCGQVILLCDSWYPKKPVTGLVTEFENLEMVCCARPDTVLYDLPGERTGRRGRPPRIHNDRLELSDIALDKPKGVPYMGCRKVITNFSQRWNIETSYYETKTFWSFRDIWSAP